MTREQANVRQKLIVGLVSAGLLGLSPVPQLRAQTPGSVKHSSTRGKKKTKARATTPNRKPAANRATSRNAARRGYRAGYRHGSYNGRYDARKSWRRWRAVTGLVALGVYAATRPKQSTTVVVTGTTYYYAGGVYYVQSGSGYTVVAAPPGAVVHAVPTYTTVVYEGSTPYYYAGGAYYVATDAPAPQPPPEEEPQADEPIADDDPSQIPMVEDDHNYEVVPPPVGATVPYVPDEADEETVGGKKYFVYADTWYRPFASDGETIYMVAEDPRKG